MSGEQAAEKAQPRFTPCPSCLLPHDPMGACPAESDAIRARVRSAIAEALSFDDVALKPIRRGPGDWTTATEAATDAVMAALRLPPVTTEDSDA